MAPLPKPEGQRVRRNLGQKHWRTITRGAVPVPPMPGATSMTKRQREVAEEYWTELWTEYGELYTSADRFPLARLCRLHARAIVGRRGLSAQAEGELRQLEQAYAASPYGRQRLMVQVAEPTEPTARADDPAAPVDLAAQRARRARLTQER